MAEKILSVEYNLDENSDSEGYKNEDTEDNESIVPDSDPNSSDIEVSSVVSSEVSSDHIYLGDELDDNGPNTVIDATVPANANIPLSPLLRLEVPVYLKNLMFLWQQH